MAKYHRRKVLFFFLFGWTEPLIWISLFHKTRDCVLIGAEVACKTNLQWEAGLCHCQLTHIDEMLRFDMNWDWRGNTEGDTTLREKVDRKRHRQHDLPQGTTSWKKEMDDDHMKNSSHMQHISSASTEKQLWPSCYRKTMLRTVKKNKLHCLNGGNGGIGQHMLYISCNDNWPEDCN